MLLSIIIINYNNKAGLLKTIESLPLDNFNYEKPTFEYIFVDGGSTDGSIELLECKVGLTRKNVKFLFGPDKGIYDAYNKGLKQATGKFIGFVNSGDALANKEIIFDILTCIKDNKDVYGIYGDGTIQSRFKSIWRVRKAGEFKRWKVRLGWMPPHPLFCIKKTVFENYGNFDTSITIAADYDLLLRFFYFEKLPTKYLKKVLVNMEIVTTSGGGIHQIFKTNRQVLASWKRHNSYSPIWIGIIKPLSKIFEFRWRSKVI